MKKILFFLFIVFLQLNAIKVTLEIDTDDRVRDDVTGKILPAVSRGEEFNITVNVEGGGRNTSTVEFKNNDVLKLKKRGHTTSVQVVNNNFTSKITYQYVTSVDKVGLFEFGPAVVRDGGKSFESNNILFKVLEQGTELVKEKDYELFCKLEADKRSVVEGEPIELSLKIYKRGNILELGINPQEFPGFEVKEQEELLRTQEDLNGTVYSVLVKKYILTPLEAGLKKIKPMVVSFNIPVKKKRHSFNVFGDFGSIFEPMVKTKRVFSNSLQVNVKSLDNINKIVNGLGRFSKFKILVDKNNVVLNEPILLTLEVSGFGNLDQIVAPKLKLPSFITYYPSKNRIEREKRISYLSGKKIFEYILQVEKTGLHKIDPQEFVFFDTDSRSYKTLYSNSIKLNIRKPKDVYLNIQNNDSTTSINENNNDTHLKIKNQKYKKDINFIEEDPRFLLKSSSLKLSIFWFFILLCLPFLAFFKSFFKKIFKKIFVRKLEEKFEEELDLIIRDKKTSNLYQFFIHYFSKMFNLQKNDVTESFIEKKLLSLNWSQDRIDQFLSYLHLCASLTFASSSKDYLDQEKLLQKSKYWFFLLESKK